MPYRAGLAVTRDVDELVTPLGADGSIMFVASQKLGRPSRLPKSCVCDVIIWAAHDVARIQRDFPDEHALIHELYYGK